MSWKIITVKPGEKLLVGDIYYAGMRNAEKCWEDVVQSRQSIKDIQAKGVTRELTSRGTYYAIRWVQEEVNEFGPVTP